MKTTLTIQHKDATMHLKSFRNGVIESTTVISDAKQFSSKAEAVQYSKDNKGLLAWRATTHE